MFRIAHTARAARTARTSRTSRGTRTAAAAVLATLALTATTAAAPAGATSSGAATGSIGSTATTATARVSGSARIHYALSPDDEIRFTVNAESAPYTHPVPGVPTGLPTDARGTVHFSHRTGSGDFRQSDATVDCLSTGGPVATLSAVITKSDAMPVGQRIGLSVYDAHGQGKDRLGFSWGVGNMDLDKDGNPYQPVVGTCMAIAPFAPVTAGGFTVQSVELSSPPTP
ncbi:hypothetical protein ACIRVF_13575 [Kitasatospora sp. NPDC101157]|uniref:hypothetical protein n=1 Tax=Kitasatospora sp. NPDC101157 TaxID=3364098 RepID=UPI00380C27D1